MDKEGFLLKAHLKRHWNLATPSTNRQTLNFQTSFFGFLNAGVVPIAGRSVWAVLAYFQHTRSEILTLYDIRVAKQIN